MLPFSSFEFFIFMAIFIAIIAVAKLWVKNKYYKYVLGCLNLIFLVFVYPKPIHFLLLIGYAYFATYLLSDILKIKRKIWGILILLLPMLLVKLDIRVHFYPFVINDMLSFAGLSYACFRIMSYYMDKTPHDKPADFITYFNFLSFTPTILIGPIERYGRFKHAQDEGFLSINSNSFMLGWNALVKGVVFKYICAELIDRYWLSMCPANEAQWYHILNDMYAYYAYLFFDFAGYSLMALGIGKMMGMEVPVNFKNPFSSVNPQDFWRKFHISLGEWLKDYFFTPLYTVFTRQKNLKKFPLLRQNTAILLTFFLMGCWNGFQKHFILSGLLFGIYSAVHNSYVVQCKKKCKDVIFGNLHPVAVRILSIFIMINLIALALYVFSGRFL
jgi:membrane protein involved in D-alanine export